MIDLRALGDVTSGYGSRTAPTAGASTNHKGLDIVLTNPEIPAVMTGTVDYVGRSDKGGNMVYIKQADGVTARYLHLAELPDLSVGDVIREGETVGIMGATGNVTGTHLHIDFQRGGTTLDPDDYFDTAATGGSAAFVKTENSGDLKSILMEIGGKLLTFVVVVLVLVLAVVLFMKAFDIHIM